MTQVGGDLKRNLTGFFIAGAVVETLEHCASRCPIFVKFAALSLTMLLLGTIQSRSAESRPPVEFQITKITKNLITAPLLNHEGAQQYEADRRALWLEVEIEFAAAPAWTDELTAKYFILLNGKLLTGEVTHVNVPAGRELRSVMYVPPRTLAHFNGDRPLAANSIRNIAVQLVQGGAVKSEASLERAAPGWFAAVPAVTGFLLNKNETPFAPLYWDRYEQIKSR